MAALQELSHNHQKMWSYNVPELPDIEAYLHALRQKTAGQELVEIRLKSPFLLRSVEPALDQAHGRCVVGYSRTGKRIVFELEGDLFLVLHLMIAGRLRWKSRNPSLKSKNALASFEFESGAAWLTEASSKKRASLYVVSGAENLAEHDPGGVDPLAISLRVFKSALTVENHTIKRSLTDPRILSGIGNAYSDEILFAAQMSPYQQTQSMSDDDYERLFNAVQTTLTTWRDRMIEEIDGSFPDKVTAFRPDMFVHGRYKETCKVCGTKIQRIRYASNEANYCPTCQNEGRLFADRSLSRLLKKDWPRTAEELELMMSEKKID